MRGVHTKEGGGESLELKMPCHRVLPRIAVTSRMLQVLLSPVNLSSLTITSQAKASGSLLPSPFRALHVRQLDWKWQFPAKPATSEAKQLETAASSCLRWHAS